MTDKEPANFQQALLDGLDEVLSPHQIRHIAAVALLCMDEDGLTQLVSRLDEETGKILSLVMETWYEVLEHRGSSGEVHDDVDSSTEERELLEEWNKAWDDFQTIIDETYDEHSRYVYQDAHWEPPYLSAWDIARELDAVAARLMPLIPRIVELDLDPDFNFALSISDANREIGAGLEEWIVGWKDEGVFGPIVTRCILEWEWCAALAESSESQPPSLFNVIDGFLDLQHEEKIPLDRGILLSFVFDFDEAHQRDVHEGILRNRLEPQWSQALADINSDCFKLHEKLLRRFDSAGYFELCKESIDKDWRRAFPVLKDLMDRGAYDEAETVARRAAYGWLGRGFEHDSYERKWNMQEELLVDRCRYIDPEGCETELLNLWIEAARRSERTELEVTLELQRTILLSRTDWDTVFGALRATEEAGCSKLAETLYQCWRAQFVKREPFSNRSSENWVELLADAAYRGTKVETFQKSLRKWIKHATRSTDVFTDNAAELAILSFDLKPSKLDDTLVGLYRALDHSYSEDRDHQESRQSWLLRLEASSLFDELIECWRKRVAAIIPDPSWARDKSYQREAEWLRVAYDLNRTAFERTLKSWAQEHRLKRNLWKAVESHGMPVPSRR